MENTRESEQNENMIIEFFSEDGYLELRADDVAAHIELESSVVPSLGLFALEIPLPSIGLPGFTVRVETPDWDMSAKLTFNVIDSRYSHCWPNFQASHRDRCSIISTNRLYLRL